MSVVLTLGPETLEDRGTRSCMIFKYRIASSAAGAYYLFPFSSKHLSWEFAFVSGHHELL
jgi:hypothetical protein